MFEVRAPAAPAVPEDEESEEEQKTKKEEEEEQEEDERAFFVPGMLPPDAAEAEGEGEAAAGGGPRCLFVCCAKDAASPFELDGGGCGNGVGGGGALPMPALLRRTWRPAPEHARRLPAGLFARLLARAARWSQFTSGEAPALARTRAALTFGGQRFALTLAFQQRAIRFEAAADGSCHFPLGVAMTLKSMLDEVLEQVHPLLRCAVGVSAVCASGAGGAVGAGGAGGAELNELLDLEQLQAAAAGLTPESTAVVLGGVQRPVAPLLPWLALNDRSPAAGFDVFLSCHDVDAAFAGRLADCLGRRALAGRGRVRVFPGFTEGREERLQGIARSRVFVPVVSAACLERWHHDKPPMTVIQLFVLACALGTVAHIAVDVAFTVSVAPGSKSASTWKFVVMLLSLVLPCAAQAWAVSTAMKAEAADGRDLAMWQQRHSGVFPVFFLLGCVRPDLMVSLMRCRAFGWDLFDAPLKVGTCSYLSSFALVSTALHDIPQLVAQWHANTLVARVAMGCGLASLLYTLASRWLAFLFLSASARVRHRRPAQQWGRDEVDPLLLEWMVALDVSGSRARGSDMMSYDRFRREGDAGRKPRAAPRRDLAVVMPVVVDAIGRRVGGREREVTVLDFELHRGVPTATAEAGRRALPRLLGAAARGASAVRLTLHELVHRVVNLPGTIDVAGELARGRRGQAGASDWEVFERLAEFIARAVGELER